MYLPPPIVVLRNIHMHFKEPVMAKLDLCNSFYSVPKHEKEQYKTTCCVNKQYYSFSHLPMGLPHAPKILATVTYPLIQHARVLYPCAKLWIHLYDIFIPVDSSYIHSIIAHTVSVFTNAGFEVNYTKSIPHTY